MGAVRNVALLPYLEQSRETRTEEGRKMRSTYKGFGALGRGTGGIETEDPRGRENGGVGVGRTQSHILVLAFKSVYPLARATQGVLSQTPLVKT